MTDNYDLMENNEVGAKAMGGTEMYMRFIYDGDIPREHLEHVQIIPSRLRDLKEDKIRIYFEHNLPNDNESLKALKEESMRKKFHKIIFLSNWHYQQFQNYVGVPYSSQSGVIEGGFYVDDTPLPPKPDPKETIHIAYFTTPHRGLELLIPVFEHLAKEDPKIHLHVHSSFQMYGWDQRDEQFEPLYKRCREHPQITYHGFTEYHKLRELLPSYHIYAYPDIWPETMCRSVLEGMLFGLVCVHPNLAAIPDTTGCLNPFMYAGTADVQEHANIFFNHLRVAINVLREGNENLNNQLMFNRAYIIARYNTKVVHYKWQQLLMELNQKYPTVESRKFPSEEKPQFLYQIP